MGYVVLGLGGVFLLALLIRGFVQATPAQLAHGLKWGVVVVAIGTIVLLAVTERLAPLLAVLGAVLPFLLQARGAWRVWRGVRSSLGAGGGASAWGPQP